MTYSTYIRHFVRLVRLVRLLSDLSEIVGIEQTVGPDSRTPVRSDLSDSSRTRTPALDFPQVKRDYFRVSHREPAFVAKLSHNLRIYPNGKSDPIQDNSTISNDDS
jgi:hypothetical protein